MPIYFSPESLTNYSIARSHSDNGTRFQGDTPFSQKAKLVDFLQGSGGTCRVSIVSQTFSSHAGTHADNPAHFKDYPSMAVFSDDLYTGKSTVLDVSNALRSDLMITRTMLEDTFAKIKNESDIERILLRTSPESLYARVPQSHFAHLQKSSAEFLVSKGVRMVAIDTPSVDHPEEKCLSGAVHGVLYDARAAIVENIDLSNMTTGCGELVTVFDPARQYADARGISQMYFFPSTHAS